MIDKHIEAAAAAVNDKFSGLCLRRDVWEELAQIAITAYCESLACAGEDGVVEAMQAAADEVCNQHSDKVDHITLDGMMMRAALAVARASMGEGERDAARLDWIVDDSKCYWVEVQSQPSGDYVYRGGGYGLRDALDEVMSAVRAKEAGHDS